ncbi:M48 family metallopeptidase [Ruminococcaceae bacterium OttesenSCG-928-O06]|nr:M48 family metallopeptidase [Ruminococcaceae bacterium OttesenSCG-928-O06]
MATTTQTRKNAPAPQLRRLATPAGVVEYTLTRKKLRNFNLRVRVDGSVAVSAPPRMPQGQIDAFLQKKAAWILRHQAAAQSLPAPAQNPYTPAQCLALFTRLSDEIFPLFASLLGGEKPALRVREMKTRWGSCNVKKRRITLNTRLAMMPRAAQEYVVLHEYVHFLHPNHQAGFYAELARLMPDWKARKKLLG